jgi:hypothetical protein
LLVRWRRRQGCEGRAVGGVIVCRCNKQGMLWWMRLMQRRVHLKPHQDNVGRGIVQGGPRRGVDAPTIVAGAAEVIGLAFPPSPCPYPCFFHRCWGWGRRGEGPPEDTTVPSKVSTEDTLLLRVQSRMRRSVLRLPSCPAQSPRVRGRCGRC